MTTLTDAPSRSSAGFGVRRIDEPEVLLALWEEASAVPECAVGAVLLVHAGLVPTASAALDLPLSSSSALLARLWTATFGALAECRATCPGCASELELALPVAELADLPDQVTGAPVAGRPLVVRCPTTRDLLALPSGTDSAAADARDELLARCLRDEDGGPVHPADLDAAARADVEATAERMAGTAATCVNTTCPDCGTPVRLDVDLARLLWERLRHEVPGTLAAVADLAAAFGWSERQVFELSPMRRAAYLEYVRGAP